MSFKDAIQVASNFKNVELGSVEFLAKILALIIQKFEEASFEDILQLSKIFNGIVKLQTESIYIKMEDFLLNYDLSSVS